MKPSSIKNLKNRYLDLISSKLTWVNHKHSQSSKLKPKQNHRQNRVRKGNLELVFYCIASILLAY